MKNNAPAADQTQPKTVHSKQAEENEVREKSKPKNKAPLLTVPMRKQQIPDEKNIKENGKIKAKAARNVNIKGWDDESLIYDDIGVKHDDFGVKKSFGKNDKQVKHRKKEGKKIKTQRDSSMSGFMKTSMDTLKTMQTLSKLAGYDQKKTGGGGGVMDLVGSLLQSSGPQKAGGKSGTGIDPLIDPLLDTAVSWLGGGKNSGIKNIVKPLIENLLT